jgi:hypothetical protein
MLAQRGLARTALESDPRLPDCAPPQAGLASPTGLEVAVPLFIIVGALGDTDGDT